VDDRVAGEGPAGLFRGDVIGGRTVRRHGVPGRPLWHCRHPASEFPSMDPVRQLGAVTPPWQLTLAQVRAALSNAAGPALALYAARKTISPGGTRKASFPGRALARL
jgi:hypothetical protein